MDRPGYGRIPPALCHWITFLVRALPARSIPTFLELLIGAMLTRRGLVSEAWLAIAAQRHWSSYYKWLEQGRWSWLRLGQYLGVLVRRVLPYRVWYWVIDDTLSCRASDKAPDSRLYHNHGHKPNRPRYLHGQCWVSLAVVVGRGRLSPVALPLLGRLQRAVGQGSKLTSARTLIRAMGWAFDGRKVRLLLDSWYMRRRVIDYALGWGIQVIGQVRRDTALYALPPDPLPGQRGRPRRYGEKYTPEQVAALPEHSERLWLYGRYQRLRYRSVQAKARFLGGRVVRAVWVQFEDERGRLSPPRLLLASEAALRPRLVILAYARRWAIEPMFCQGRHAWGWGECWQQSRQGLARWVQIQCLAYTLVHLLVLCAGSEVSAWACLTPWRHAQPLTGGRVRLGLQRLLGQVNVRAWWDPKGRKFRPPDSVDNARLRTKLPNVA